MAFDRFERQNFDEPIRGDLHLSGQLHMKPHRSARRKA